MADAAEAYDQWFRAKVQEALDDERPGTPDEKVAREFAALRTAILGRAEFFKLEEDSLG